MGISIISSWATLLSGCVPAPIEWSGLRQLDHDPFRSFAGSEEIKLALAARIIEAHGGTANFLDKKFAVELPLN